MTICGKISGNALRNCDDPIVQGIDNDLVLINFGDWKAGTITKNAINKNIVEGITLPAGSPTITGYKLQGINYSNDEVDSMVKGKYLSTWDHKLTCIVFGNDPDYKKFIEDLKEGRFVVIVKNNYNNLNKSTTPSDSVYEILGMTNGLEVLTCERNKSDKDTQGAFKVELGCNADVKEPHLPATLYKTDLATTAAIVAALL